MTKKQQPADIGGKSRALASDPENIPGDGVSLFDLHEDMQTVDAISLPDQREELMKEKHNHSSRLSGDSADDYGAPR